MRRMKTRIMSILLAIVMMLGLMPAVGQVVYAADGDLQNVTISADGVLSWDAFPGAARYEYNINLGKAGGYISGTSRNLADACAGYGWESGTYDVSLWAIDSSNNQISNKWTGTYTYTAAKPKLATPSNVTWSGYTVSWDPVPNAQQYVFTFEGKANYLTSNFIDVSPMLKGGTHEYLYRIYAKAEGYPDSDDYFDGVELTKAMPDLQNVTISTDGVLSWDAFPGAYRYAFLIGSGGGFSYSTSKNLADSCAGYGWESGTYPVSLWAVDNEDHDLSNRWTGEFTYIKTTTYTVTFDSSGGSAVASQTVNSGDTATKPADPTRGGYTFDGWYEDASYNVSFDFTKPITSNITLFAKWTEGSSTFAFTTQPISGTAKKTDNYAFSWATNTTPDSIYLDIWFPTVYDWGPTVPLTGLTSSSVEYNSAYADGNVSKYRIRAIKGSDTIYSNEFTVTWTEDSSTFAFTTQPISGTAKKTDNYDFSWATNTTPESIYLDMWFPTLSDWGANVPLTGLTSSSVEYNSAFVDGNVSKYRIRAIKGSDTIYSNEFTVTWTEDSSIFAFTTQPISGTAKKTDNYDFSWATNTTPDSIYLDMWFPTLSDWGANVPLTGLTSSSVSYNSAFADGNVSKYRIRAIKGSDTIYSNEFTVTWTEGFATSYIVTAGTLNVREAADTSSARIGGLSFGDVVTVTGFSGKWASIDLGGTTGWIDSTYLALTYSEETAIAPENYTVTVGALNVREEPSTSSTRIGGVKLDDVVLVTGKLTDGDGNEWLVIDYPTEDVHKVGFIMAKYTEGESAKEELPSDTLSISSLPSSITDKSAINLTKIALGSTVEIDDDNIMKNADGTLTLAFYPDDALNMDGLTKNNVTLPADSKYQVKSVEHNSAGYLTIILEDPSAKSHKVMFDTDGGSAVDAQTVNDGEKATKPDDPTKVGYTFDGWYIDNTFATAFDFDTAITADTTIYAKWTENKTVPETKTYTVKFNVDGGSSVEDQTVDDGKTAAKPSDPTKEGYTFDGWYEDSTFAAAFDFSKAITVDTTVYAKWTNNASEDPTDPEVKKHTISYDLNGGTLDGKTGIITVQAEEGSTITIPAAPTRDGYKFTYWKGSEYHPGDSYKVEGDHTFTAQWEKVNDSSDDKKDDSSSGGNNSSSGSNDNGSSGSNNDNSSGTKTSDDGKKNDSSKTNTTGSNTTKKSDTKTAVPATGVSAPKTGDESNMILWGFLGIASLLGLAFVMISRRRYLDR